MAKAPRDERVYFYHHVSILGGTSLKPKVVFFVIRDMKSDAFSANIDPASFFIESNVAVQLPKRSKFKDLKDAEEFKRWISSGPNSGPNIVDGKEAYPSIELRSSTLIPPLLASYIMESRSHCPIDFSLLVLSKIMTWDKSMKDDRYCESTDDKCKMIVCWLLVVSWKHMRLVDVIETTSLFPSLDTAVNLAAQKIQDT